MMGVNWERVTAPFARIQVTVLVTIVSFGRGGND